MIVSRGYEATKIRDIAEELHISTGLFFNYFESKEKLYEELVKQGMRGPQLMVEICKEELAPINLFEKLTEVIFQAVCSNFYTAQFFVLMMQAHQMENLPDSVKKLVVHMDMFTPFVPVVEKGQQLGQIKDGNPRELLAGYWGAVQGIVECYALCSNWPLPQSNWVVDILRK